MNVGIGGKGFGKGAHGDIGGHCDGGVFGLFVGLFGVESSFLGNPKLEFLTVAQCEECEEGGFGHIGLRGIADDAVEDGSIAIPEAIASALEGGLIEGVGAKERCLGGLVEEIVES